VSEADLLRSIRDRFAVAPDVILWRNNTGRLQDATRRWVTFGLGVGSADLVGLVRPGRFFALECKAGRGKETPEQLAWAKAVRAMGGFVATVRTVDEAIAALAACRSGI
jgi:hypothetical protein